MKYVPASIDSAAFNCPHCHVLTSQHWHIACAAVLEKKGATPRLFTSDDDHDWDEIKDPRQRDRIIEHVRKALSGYPFLSAQDNDRYVREIINLSVSVCFSCDRASLWLGDRLIYPELHSGPVANADTPKEILKDYEEASAILHKSPRGSAALVRLCIQKLCKHLDQPGDNLNADIGALVARGLDTRVQMALDAVRVIGNNAVHPGQIDLRDDRQIAETLFRLFNLIVEKLISEPKMVDEVYAKLPPGVRAQIDRRDASKS